SAGTISTIGIYAGETKMGDASLVSGTLWRYSAHAVAEGTYTIKAKATASDSTVKESAERVLTITKAYTVTYNGNGNTGGSVPTDTSSYASGATVIVKGNDSSLVKTGYNFGGWNTKADGSSTTYQADNTFTMGAANVTLYAKWIVLPTYKVTYEANGATSGSVPTDSNNYLQGASVTVLSNTDHLIKSGYTLVGWETKADGSGTTYEAGNTFTMGATHVTLYAKWILLPIYKVTYDANGATSGSSPTDNNDYHQNAIVTILGNNGDLKKTKLIFSCWNTSADGTGVDIAANSTLIMPSNNVILYAKWRALIIGDVGPAGGTIISDTKYLFGDFQYIEAAPAYLDQGMLNWGMNMMNWHMANSVCDSYVHDGYDDWLMPSIEMMNLLYNAIIKTGKIHLTYNEWMWSSTGTPNIYLAQDVIDLLTGNHWSCTQGMTLIKNQGWIGVWPVRFF
ncbi:InlB B-repeat-containing protein, partial [bacterium]|nr:InlB B-repeat-containing protein [bacterium]